MPEEKRSQFRESQMDQRQARHRVVGRPVLFGLRRNHRSPFSLKHFTSPDVPCVGRPIQQHTIEDAAEVSFSFGRDLKKGLINRIVGLHFLNEWKAARFQSRFPLAPDVGDGLESLGCDDPQNLRSRCRGRNSQDHQIVRGGWEIKLTPNPLHLM